MQVINDLPKNYVENNTCKLISKNLQSFLGDDFLLHIRSWEQKPIPIYNKKKIVIVTSAEGHKYIPEETNEENCSGVFMHYYPKVSISKQYEPENFVEMKNLYPLPLGCTDFYKEGEIKQLKDREFDCCFIGQLDPYRRMDFFNCMKELHSRSRYKNIIGFYEGWNNGYSGEKYSDIMRNSKIAFVPCGSASLDTFRFYEAASSGCIIISSQQNKYEFMKNSPHIETCWDAPILESIIEKNIENQKLADDTYCFWKTKLSPKASSDYILSKVKND